MITNRTYPETALADPANDRHGPWLTGRYCDHLTDAQGRLLWQHGWRANRIVQGCHMLLTALLKREVGVSGILYWAIGEGVPGWDARTPSPDYTDSRLTREVARKAIPGEQISYLDETGEPTDRPSTQLDIHCTFRGEDLPLDGARSLREFGLFGGDATDGADSGWMIDRVIHPRIDLGLGMTLTRHIRLSFATNGLRQEAFSGFGVTLPVMAIDGIGEIFARDLNNENIQNLADLMGLNPLRTIGSIPPGKLREFRAKAGLVAHLAIDAVEPESPLTNETISEILRAQPEQVAASIEVSPERLVALQEQLAILQVALDEAQLQHLTLGDIITS